MSQEDIPNHGQIVEGVAPMELRVCSASGCRTRENMPTGSSGLCSIHQRNKANDERKAKEGEIDESNARGTEGGAFGSDKAPNRDKGRTEEDVRADGPKDFPKKSLIVDSNGNIGDVVWREATQCDHQLTKNICKLAGQKPVYCFQCGLQLREYNRTKPYPKGKRGKK